MIFPFVMKMFPMALAVSVSSNLDNIAIGTSISFRNIGLRFRDNIVVATVTTIGTLLSAAAGSALTQVIPDYAESAIGGAIMLLVGVWIVYQETVKLQSAGTATMAYEPESPHVHDTSGKIPSMVPPDNRIGASELLILSLGLTLNNIPNGIGAGILHIDIWLLGALNFVASLLMLGIGLQVGRRGVRWLGRYAGFVAGVLLAALGVTEMVF